MKAEVRWAEFACAFFARKIVATIWVIGVIHRVLFVALDDPGFIINLWGFSCLLDAVSHGRLRVVYRGFVRPSDQLDRFCVRFFDLCCDLIRKSNFFSLLFILHFFPDYFATSRQIRTAEASG